MTAKRTLVTGAAGFLGKHLVQHLRATGWVVQGIERQPQPEAAQLTTCDINDAAQLAEVIRQGTPDVIFHLAALTPAAAPAAGLDDFLRVNVMGTANLLEAARKYAPEARIMLITSSAMYGYSSDSEGVVHEDSGLYPVSAYGISKAAQHLLGFQYHVQYGLDIVRVCPFNLIGYGLPRGLVASDFAYQIAAVEHGRQEAIIQVGDLSAQRDFLDVQDAVSALIKLVVGGETNEAYNLASTQATTIRDLLHELINLSDVTIAVQTRPNTTPNPVPSQIGAHDKLAAATGWKPQVPLKQSLADVLAYWRAAAVRDA